MTEQDRAAKVAKELLPCNSDCYLERFDDGKEEWIHSPRCPHAKRSAVAAKLREAYAEIKRFKTMSTVEMMCENLNVKHHVEEWERRCLKAEAEIPRLRAELAGIEQFAESWPCHCAENYPGATMYHGQDCQTAIAIEFVAQWRAAKEKA